MIKQNSYSIYQFCGILILFILSALPGNAAVNIETDWDIIRGNSDRDHFGINIWNGMDPNKASNATYKTNLNQIAPRFIRYHAGEQINPDTHAKSWLDDSAQTWDASVVTTVLSNRPSSAEKTILTITGWPSWMKDPANGSRLDPSKINQFAQYCADLVRITNVDNNFNIEFWEPFNEKDKPYTGDEDQLADIFKAARDAMLAVDSSIKIGGPAWQDPWDTEGMGRFLNQIVSNGTSLDFYSYHHYGTGSSGESVANIYNRPAQMKDFADWVMGALISRGMDDVPVWIDEYNIFFAWNQDQTRRLMASEVGMVFHALCFKNLIEAGNIEGLNTWNESDGIYGMMNDSAFGGNFAVRPTGRLFEVAIDNLTGSFVKTTSSDSSKIESFAAFEGNRYSLMLINRSQASQTVNTSFLNWTPTSTSYQAYTVGASGLSQSSGNFTGNGPDNLNLAADSVMILVFTDNSGRPGGRVPWGGTPHSIPGRIEAEHYDQGGQYVGYYDTDWETSDTDLRMDRVEVTATNDGGVSGHSISGAEDGEWMAYTTDIQPGIYTVNVRHASRWGGSKFSVRINDSEIFNLSPSITWSTDTFKTVTVENVEITGGAGSELLILFEDKFQAINWIEFVKTGDLPGVSNYWFYGEAGDDFTPEGGSIRGYRVSTETRTSDGSPDGGEYRRITDTGHYATYAFDYPSALDKSSWESARIEFWARTTGGWSIGIADNSGSGKRIGLSNYMTTDGTWQLVSVPVSDFTPDENLSNFVSLYFYHLWTAGNSLDIDSVRVVSGSGASSAYHLYSDSGSEFITEGGSTSNWAMGVQTLTSGSPEGSEHKQITVFNHYATYSFDFPGGSSDKSAWSGKTLKFQAKSTTPGLSIRFEDATGARKTLSLSTYMSHNGTWEDISIPVNDFTGVNLSQLEKVYFYRQWSGTYSLEFDHLRVE
ncbi:MAG: cellulase family glycosylhydrolase [Verrucomicrobiota bacterium]